MQTVNEVLLDEMVAHAIGLTQYGEGLARQMLRLLNRADADLATALAAALERLPADAFTVQRLDATLEEVRRMNRLAYQAVNEQLLLDLRGLAEHEAEFHHALLSATLPQAVRVSITLSGVTPATLHAAISARPFQGRLLGEWASRLEADRMERLRDAVRLGYVEGQTNAEIVRRIRGTRAAHYADGVLERNRRDLMAVTRTAVSHTAATAREHFIQANRDVIKAERWVSTLDTRTSSPCRLRDGHDYSVGDHKPIGHAVPWLGGPGRLHWQCRSTSVPVVKSLRELGIAADELPPGTRASMDGQVPAGTTYAAWLARQSAARQDDILGPVRGRLLRAGGLKPDDFYDNKGRWLTLEQLKARDAQAFARAHV